MHTHRFIAAITILATLVWVGETDAGDVAAMLVKSPGAGDLVLVNDSAVADIYVDPHDAVVAQIAAKLLSEDIQRVTTHKPAVKNDAAALGRTAILIGKIGKSSVIDALIESDK